MDLILDDDQVGEALTLAWRFGQIDGDHHRLWVIDQMVRALTSPEEYERFVASYEEEDYQWDTGIAP